MTVQQAYEFDFKKAEKIQHLAFYPIDFSDFASFKTLGKHDSIAAIAKWIHNGNVENGFYDNGAKELDFLQTKFMINIYRELGEVFEQLYLKSYDADKFAYEVYEMYAHLKQEAQHNSHANFSDFMKEYKNIGAVEIADIAIYCLDRIGYLSNGMKTDGYMGVSQIGLPRDTIGLLLAIPKFNNPFDILHICIIISFNVGFNLWRLIGLKVLYNQTRGKHHGKLTKKI